MKSPKFQVGDFIQCEAIVGWVRRIFLPMEGEIMFVYAIEEPESEAILYFSEEELS
jgi:hypothetical protein